MFFVVVLQSLLVSWSSSGRGRLAHDRGQTTAEYALVLIGAAALALLLIAWATRTDRIGLLFEFVMDNITGRVQ